MGGCGLSCAGGLSWEVLSGHVGLEGGLWGEMWGGGGSWGLGGGLGVLEGGVGL